MIDPVDDELNRVRKESAAARSALYRGAQVDPDAAARRAQLARRLKTSTAVVAQDEPRLRADDNSRRVASQFNPEQQAHVRRLLLDNEANAEVAHDDISLLGAISDLITSPWSSPRSAQAMHNFYKAKDDFTFANVGKALKTGAARIEQGARGLDQLVVEAIAPDSALADYTRNRSKQWADYVNQVRPKARSRLGRDVLSGFESIPGSVAAAGATLVTGNPYVGAGILGATTGGQSYSEARAEGLSVGKAAAKGTIDAVIETGTEYLGQKYLAQDIDAGSSFRKFLWNQVKSEVPTEQLATLGQDFNQWAMIDANKGKDFGDYIDEIPDNAWSTLVSTLVTTGVTAGTIGGVNRVANRIYRRDTQAQNATEEAESVGELMKLATASKLRTRDPETFQRFIEIASEDGDVDDIYVAPETLGEVLNQSGIEPEQQAAAMAALGPRVALAASEGTDVRIPVSEFATVLAGTPAGDALLDHIKTDPNGMSRLEAEQYMQERGDALKAEIDKAIEDKASDDIFQQSAESVKTDILRQLNEANRFRPEVNESYATMQGAFYAAMAARAKTTPEDLYKRYPLRIQNQNINGTVLEQKAREVTQTEEFKTWFKGSKASDAGQPKIFYHGTRSAFDQFERIDGGNAYGSGFYFTDDPTLASNYATGENVNRMSLEGNAGANVVPVYLKLRKPFDMSGKTLTRAEVSAISKAANQISPGFFKRGELMKMFDRVYPANGNNLRYQLGDQWQEVIRQAGYDGLITDMGTVVFEPTQIKSIFNKGTFDPADPNILNQSPMFFSPLEKAVEGIGLTKADGKQWLATISKTPGVKKEELEWTDLPEWLSEQSGPVTKEEVLAFVKAGGIQVEEVVKSDDPYANEEEKSDLEYTYAQEDFDTEFSIEINELDVEDDFDRQTIDMFDPEYVRPFAKTIEARFEISTPWGFTEAKIAEVTGAVFDPTDSGSYTLGAFDTPEEAREAADKAKGALFDALMDNGYFDDARRRAEEQFGPKFQEYVTNPGEGEDYTELLLTLPPGVKGNPEDVYQGGHWDEPNVVAHLRFDKRTDAEGETVLMIHEIQSDWHQTGRDRGYKTVLSDEERKALNDQIDTAEAELVQIKARPEYVAWLDEMNANRAEYQKAYNDLQDARSIMEMVAGTRDYADWAQSIDDFVADALAAQPLPGSSIVRSEEEIRRAVQAVVDLRNKRDDLQITFDRSIEAPFRAEILAAQDRINSARTKLTASGGVPDAPFKGTGYAALALKRAIRWAVDQGDVDKIAWIRGEQQNGWEDGSGAWFYNETNVGKDGKERPGVLLSVAKDVLKKSGANVEIEKYYGIDGMEPKAEDKILLSNAGRTLLDYQIEVARIEATLAGGTEMASWELERWETQLESAKTMVEDMQARQEAQRLESRGDGHLGFRITPELEAAAQQGFALFQTNRGAYSPATDTITLLKSADLSTFLHESGHFFLEMLDRMAEGQGAQDIKDDFDTVLKWFKVKDAATWRGMTLEQKRKHHEKFARGFEAYLYSGKSPSVKLQGIFQRFRAWLIAVYKKAKALDVTVTPEIRGVMDRLLATADEIAEAEAARSMLPMFENEQQSGMSPDQWRAYQELGLKATQDAQTDLETRSLRDMRWLTNAKGREVNRLKRQATATRARVREEVAREVLAEPVYRAEQFLRKGVLDGAKVEGPHKLYTPEIKAEYGEEAAALVEQLKGMTSTDNGVNPQQIAEMFGFTSVDHMLVELTSAEPLKEKIDGLTEQRLLQEYGDLIDDESINRAADEAVHNEARTRFVATELAALSKATGKQNILSAAAKQFAAESINRQRVRDLRPAQYDAAAARSAKRSQDAMRKGDLAAAAAEKRNQLINMHAGRAARKAQSDAQKSVDYLKKFLRPQIAKSVDPDYVAQINALLEAVELKRTTNRTLDRRASLAAWIEEQREQGFEPVISEDLLDSLTRRNFRDMTVEELRGLIDAVKNIEHLGRLKNRLLTAKRDRDFASAVGNATGIIRQNAVKTYPVELERKGWIAAAKRGGAQFLAMHRKFASVIRQMDGFQDGGYLWELFVRSMNEAGDREASMRAEATAQFMAILKPVEGRAMNRKQYIPAIGRSLSLEGRLAIALNQGNDINRERVLSGENWTQEELDAINATLTTEEWQVVQQLWDYIGSYWPQIAAKERRVTGVEPERVDAEPLRVVTKDGDTLDLAGGYYPIKYNTDRSGKADAHDAAEAARQALRGAYTASTTRRGHTKARVESTGRALRYDLGVALQHVTEVVHDLSWHEWLIDANRLLKASLIDNAIREHYGPETARAMRKAFEDIAAGDIPAANVFEAAVNHLRTGVTIANMGWSLSTSLLQPLGLTQSMKRIGPKWVARGLSRWATDAATLQNTVAWIGEQSEFMRTRSLTQQREISEIRNQISGKAKALQAVEASFFTLIAKFQLIADVPTWIGQYEKSVAAGEDHDRAVSLADQAVLDSQGGGQIKDLAQIQRGGPLMKLWTNFYSYFNVSYNLLAESVGETRLVGPKRLPLLAADVLLLVYLPATLGFLLRSTLRGDDNEPEEIVDALAKENISATFALMVGLREVGSIVQSDGRSQAPAGLAMKQFSDVYSQAKQGEADEAFFKATNRAAGILFHYPSGQVERTARGIMALWNDETDNPMAVFLGPPR